MLDPAIPKIIHLLWSNRHQATDTYRCLLSWKTYHPRWKHRQWSAREAEEFVAKHYPDILNRYLNYQWEEQRIDAFRYLLLQYVGGLCIDPEVECLRPFDPLIQDRHFLIGFEPYAHAKRHGKEYLLSKALLVAAPGTPFLKQIIELIATDSRDSNQAGSNGEPLLQVVFEQIGDRQISLFPPIVFSPLIAHSAAARQLIADQSVSWLIRGMLNHQHAYAIHHRAELELELELDTKYKRCLRPELDFFSAQHHFSRASHWTDHDDGYLFRQTNNKPDSKGIITIIAWNRPLYLEQVLESIYHAHHHTHYDIHISVDYHLDTLLETLMVIDAFEAKTNNKLLIELHKKNIGNTGNTRRSCEHAFIENSYETMIHLEDDTIMGEDYILWSEWAQMKTGADENCFAICPFIPQESRLEEGLISTDHQTAFKRNFFEAQGGFTLNRAQYAHIERMGGLFGAWHPGGNYASPAEWKRACEIDDALPFDGPMRFYFLGDKYTLSPSVSRAQNIGEEDGMWNPNKAWHNEHIQNIYWIDSPEFGRINKSHIQYRLLNLTRIKPDDQTDHSKA